MPNEFFQVATGKALQLQFVISMPFAEESRVLSVCLRPRLEVIVAGAEIDDALLLRTVELVALGPVVARGVREDLPAAGERAARDRLVHRLRRLQLCARVLEEGKEVRVRSLICNLR